MFYRKSIIFFTGLLFINSFFIKAAVGQNNKILSMEYGGLSEGELRGYYIGETPDRGETYDQELIGLFESTLPVSRFHLAVKSKDIDKVKSLAETENINARDSESLTPFLVSVMIYNSEIVKFFLSHPNTDLLATDILDNNVFHILFFDPPDNIEQRRKRKQVLDLLLKEEYFTKISNLLGELNESEHTALDLLYREYIGENINNSYELQQLINKGAEASLDLVHLFKSEDVTDNEKVRILSLVQNI